jgi:hypothetical protein
MNMLRMGHSPAVLASEPPLVRAVRLRNLRCLERRFVATIRHSTERGIL